MLALKLNHENLLLAHKASLHLAPFCVGPALQALVSGNPLGSLTPVFSSVKYRNKLLRRSGEALCGGSLGLTAQGLGSVSAGAHIPLLGE